MEVINHDVSIYEQFEVHGAAGVFPNMTNEEFWQLKNDIKKHGQRMPILVYHDKIVDGRQRLRACRELGVNPVYLAVPHLDMPVLSFIVSQNLHRRHLSDSQRAMVAARLTNTGVGANQHTAQAVSQKQAAAGLHVSVDSVQRAGKVIRSGHDGLIEAVDSGRLDVSNAAAVITLSQDELDKLVSESAEKLNEAAKKARKEESEKKRKLQANAVQAIRNLNRPFDHTVGPFNVIYADPPWDYMAETTLGYPTMATSEICDLLRDSDSVAYDAALFLWVPASLVGEGLKVIEAWGFRYITQAIWHKGAGGMGQYFRVNHEVLLFGLRGHRMPQVAAESRSASVFQFDRRVHSQKPDEFYEVIEAMYPDLPKMELFRRGVPRDGWHCWGNEVQHGPAVPLGQQIVDAMAVEQVVGELVEMAEAGDAVNDLGQEVA
ncbi:hypothetical protein WI99_25140 [Burkholderia cepacia]|uniref:MT-A70 family methyltransferase n=1 Tax=Burkholderia cepacia TaxID=292 RepID=UPI00075DE1BD|nr:MT-A70 family methyltransferase [Burkholderia cepacia]KVE81058.1 hypothetical protein WI99_25140 [Burkholderia cepacia]